jgi:transposase-like protein
MSRLILRSKTLEQDFTPKSLGGAVPPSRLELGPKKRKRKSGGRKSDLSVDDRYRVVMAVKDGKAAGKKVADVLKDLGVGKNSYARYVKQLKEVGHLQSSKKGRVGAKRKVRK